MSDATAWREEWRREHNARVIAETERDALDIQLRIIIAAQSDEVARLRAALERISDAWDEYIDEDVVDGMAAAIGDARTVLGRGVETTPEPEWSKDHYKPSLIGALRDAAIKDGAACPTCGSTDRAVSVRGLKGATLHPFVCDDAWHDGETPER
jgi:hypothetical protein